MSDSFSASITRNIMQNTKVHLSSGNYYYYYYCDHSPNVCKVSLGAKLCNESGVLVELSSNCLKVIFNSVSFLVILGRDGGIKKGFQLYML